MATTHTTTHRSITLFYDSFSTLAESTVRKPVSREVHGNSHAWHISATLAVLEVLVAVGPAAAHRLWWGGAVLARVNAPVVGRTHNVNAPAVMAIGRRRPRAQ